MGLVHKFRTSPKLFSSVDATAFASILVVLIFIVLVVAGMSYNPHSGYSADLPTVLHPVALAGARREDAMTITITRDGVAYFGVNRIAPNNLPEKIAEHLKDRGAERKVYIVADMRARWRDVKDVLEGVRFAGIIRVAFLANQGVPVLTR